MKVAIQRAPTVVRFNFTLEGSEASHYIEFFPTKVVPGYSHKVFINGQHLIADGKRRYLGEEFKMTLKNVRYFIDLWIAEERKTSK